MLKHAFRGLVYEIDAANHLTVTAWYGIYFGDVQADVCKNLLSEIGCSLFCYSCTFTNLYAVCMRFRGLVLA